MKTFNDKIKLFLLLMVVGLCFSCKKQNEAPKPQSGPFSAVVEGGATTVPAGGGLVNVLISASSNGWWITSAQASWLTINRMYGSGDFKLPVTVKANTSGAARVIVLEVNPTFNLTPVKLTINQN